MQDKDTRNAWCASVLFAMGVLICSNLFCMAAGHVGLALANKFCRSECLFALARLYKKQYHVFSDSASFVALC